MIHDEIRRARKQLKLTQKQMADMLDTDAQSVRRWEMQPDAATRRKVPVRAMRLIKAYLSGYRPDDWPNHPRQTNRG